MALVDLIKRFFSRSPKPEPQMELDPHLFVYIRLIGNIQPIERGERFEDPIDEALSSQSLGSVSGGGSSLSDPLPDGSRVVEWCGVDVDVTDLEKALALLRVKLVELKAPDGTEIQYTMAGSRLSDFLRGGKWLVGAPRTELHPGFGV
jgi:hypothetical protein